MGFDLQPILNGDLIQLRPLENRDFNDLFLVAQDPLIWEQHPIKKRYEKEIFKSFFKESLASGGALVAIDSKTQEVIGSSRFYGYNPLKSEIEIGWSFLARSHWGGLYNGEMKHLMLQHAFKYVDKVIFLIGTNNIRSQQAIKKIGGVYKGKQPDTNGNESYIYQITKNQNEH